MPEGAKWKGMITQKRGERKRSHQTYLHLLRFEPPRPERRGGKVHVSPKAEVDIQEESWGGRRRGYKGVNQASESSDCGRIGGTRNIYTQTDRS